MEAIRSSDRGSRWECDPDDVDFPISAQATVATAAAGSTGSTMIQCGRISAISYLNEFTGKDQDEDRAQAWISNGKSAFMRDQASDDEKCLIFADLLAGSTIYSQQMDIGSKTILPYVIRSDESPLDYFYRLNVAGLRARRKIKDGSAMDRREYLDHYIEAIEDQDLTERLTLRNVSRSGSRKESSKESGISIQQRQKPTNTAPPAPAKQVRAIQIQAGDSGSDSGSDESGGSDSDIASHRMIFLAANEDISPKVEKESTNLDRRLSDRDQGHDDHNSKFHGNGFTRDRRSHCGSNKHSDLGCWRRVTCTKCGKRGHPSDHCLFVCRGCGERQDMGKCPMEEFYNQIRQWFNPTKHMDVKLGRTSGWKPIRSERSRYCVYAFVNKTSIDQVSKRPDLHGNTCYLYGKHTFAISSLRQGDEYASSEVSMSVDLQRRVMRLLETARSKFMV
ncbi:LOW QUALITY PROTEIN: hypothetical protein PHMEG_00020262 [Phytophthora megakarya]|uniref:CCHC-type domain-containing protein n=1 Tax=Phytophthora megakarya TaxID=4795 RepID=A0A225VPJ2_9STRA|nr:LOW QUALITY PROTEIN: hypothetical protein PHMEG_00020262 [Phytophthora megakarya]